MIFIPWIFQSCICWQWCGPTLCVSPSFMGQICQCGPDLHCTWLCYVHTWNTGKCFYYGFTCKICKVCFYNRFICNQVHIITFVCTSAAWVYIIICHMWTPAEWVYNVFYIWMTDSSFLCDQVSAIQEFFLSYVYIGNTPHSKFSGCCNIYP